jgi:hypothetical protein
VPRAALTESSLTRHASMPGASASISSSASSNRISFFRQNSSSTRNLDYQKRHTCSLHPIYGTGQGSANIPVIRDLISNRLFDAHTARGATFTSPDRTLQLQIFMIGFVDDCNVVYNEFVNPDQTPKAVLERATADA